jgi:amino acid adenylation domain-containing protein/non-ribosomal peptide synthase protein (TIGR01720 family)
MTTFEFLSELRDRRIRLWVEGGHLHFSAPGGLAPGYREELTKRKEEIIDLLSGVASSSAMLETIGRAGCASPIPLSFAQRRLWFIEQLMPGNGAYNLTSITPLVAGCSPRIIESSVNRIVARHEALRTSFAVVDFEPAQVIAPQLSVPLRVVDLRGMSAGQQEAEVRRFAEEEAARPFDLSRLPLLRTSLLFLAPADPVFVVTFHHIVSDAWSQRVFFQELGRISDSIAAGREDPQPELPIQYADYAIWQHRTLTAEILRPQISYWREKLSGLAQLALPTERPRPRFPTFRGARRRLHLDSGLVDSLRELGRRQDTTLFMTLLAGFQVLLARHCGNQDDVPVGTAVAGRNHAELEGLIGLFANLLVLRGDLSDNPTFERLLARTRETTVAAYSRQELPFDRVVEALKAPRDTSRNPLFQVLFQLLQLLPRMQDGARRPAGATPADEGLPVEVAATPLDLAVTLWEDNAGICGEAQYASDLFDPQTIDVLLGHFQALLSAAAAEPSRCVWDLPMAGPGEERSVREWSNLDAGKGDRPADRCLHELWEEQARRTPDAVAVATTSGRLTYRGLHARADALARRLRRVGVAPGQLVGLCLERSPELAIGLLAILKSGGAYVPLDPAYPEKRLAFMIADSGIRLLLTQRSLRGHLKALTPEGRASGPDVACLCVDEPGIEGDGSDIASADDAMAHQPAPEDLAYVIYTSGSTGTPKGAMIEHRSLCNVAAEQRRLFALEPGCRVLQFASISFDASIFEFIMAWSAGATLHIPDKLDILPGPQFTKLLNRWKIEVLTIPPTVLAAMPEDKCPTLRIINVAGEACPQQVVDRWAPGRRFFNLYGPTEAAIWATAQECRASHPVTIGRPIGNVRAYVVDGRGRLAGMGVPGELWLGGAGVGRGYLGREELTRERFVEDPFAREGEGLGGRAYRTGDRARWLPGGTLQYLGRTEAGQVKVRGQRIELGEVEAALLAHPGVAAAAAAVRDAALVAYAVPRRPAREDGPDGEPPLGPNLREHLRRMLPEGLVPSAIVLLDALPTTPGGKLDRDALPEPEREALQLSHEYEPPRTDAERALARIWGDLLQVGRIGIHDNFFELGGDSILSIQVIARANKAGFRLLPKQLFENQSIAELAGVAGLMPFVPDEGHPEDDMAGPVGLAPIQHWFLGQCEQSQARVSSFVRSITIHLAPGANVHALQQAMTSLMERHDALRFRFEGSGRDRRQRDLGPEAAAVLRRVDLKEVPEPDREAAIAATLADELREGIDPTRGPALRAVLFDLGTAVPVRLQVLVHALSADLRSCLILAQDLQRMHGGPAALGWHSSRPFRNWVSRLLDRARHPELLRELQYWSSADREGSRFPKDILNHGDTPTGAGTGSFPAPVTAPDAGDREDDAVSVQLDAAETAMIRKTLPAACMGTAEDVLLAAVARALAAWTGSISTLVHWERACCVPPVDEQATEEANRLTVGWLATCFPVCLKADPADSAAASLRSIKEQLRAVPNGGTGYGILQHLCPDAAVRQWLDTPAADRGDSISFSFEDDTPEERQQPEPDGGLLLAPPEVSPLQRSPAAPHPFAISAGIYRGRLHLRWRFDRDRCSRETTGKLVRSFVAELRALAEQCRAPGAGLAPSDFSMARISKRDLGVLLSQLRRVEMPGKGRPGPATAAAEDDPAAKGTTKRNGAGNGGARNGGSLP